MVGPCPVIQMFSHPLILGSGDENFEQDFVLTMSAILQNAVNIN